MAYTDVFGGSTVQPSDVEFSALTLTADTQTFWPSYAVTGQVLARIMKVSASAAALAITLPDATLAGIGQDVLFDNAGSETFYVLDYTGAVVATIAAGQVKYLYLSTAATPAGDWRVTLFGAGASSLDASQLVGSGIKAVGSSLNQSMPLVTVSGDLTVDATFRATTYTNTGAGVTYTLPTSATVGNNFFFAARNQGSGVVTLTASGVELVDGLSSLNLQLDESCFVVAGTGAWYTVGRGRNSQFNFTQLAKVVAGGDVALTLSEASNVVQSYSGVLASNCVVTLPAVVQVYYISNTTTGPFTLTFKAPVTGTTFVLPANQSAVVFCNGTNVTNTTTTISGATSLLLSAGSASTPTLAFVSANNGLYAPTSSSVAITNNGIEVARWGGGQQQAVDGTAAAAPYSFASDLGLGLYRAAADTLGFATGSSSRMTLDPAGTLTPGAAGVQDFGSVARPWGAAYATTYNGAGTGLTGTASALSIGGNAATASSAALASNSIAAEISTTQSPGDNTTKIATTAFVVASFAPLNSPTLTGAPVAPTPTLGDNTTKIATTAFVLANAANLNSPAFTGVPTAPTATPGTNTTQLATTEFVLNQSFSTALPAQAGNAGKFVTTDGTTASWADSLPYWPVTTVGGSSQTAVAGNHYLMTNVAASTLTLPAAPAAGDEVWVTFTNGLYANVVSRNTKTIYGDALDFTVNAGVLLTWKFKYLNNDWKTV